MTQRTAFANANAITEKVIGAAIQVHKQLGPGLLEKIYAECLAIELVDCGLQIKRELAIPTQYGNKTIEDAYRLDFLVENTLVIECKTVEQLLPIHSAQVLTYLKLLDRRLGLLINFNVEVLY